MPWDTGASHTVAVRVMKEESGRGRRLRALEEVEQERRRKGGPRGGIAYLAIYAEASEAA